MAGHHAQASGARPTSVEIRTADELPREEWDVLADRTGAPPFLRPEWVEAWHEAFGSGPLAAIAARREGRLVGVLPVQSRRGAVTSPTDWQTPLFGPVVEDGDAAAKLASALLGQARRRADLWFLDPELPGLEQAVSAAREAGFGAIVRTIARQPYLPVEGSFEGYMGGLDRKFRKDIGRRWRRLEDRGEVRVTYEDGTTDLDELLTEGFRLEGSGWKSQAGTAIASDPAAERFYRRISRWAAGRGWLALAFLHLDGRPIAFDLCFEDAGAFRVLKGGFDADERNLGPGTLLTHHQIERAFERGLESYELLGQADDYKRRWTPLARERVRFQAFPRSLAGTAERLAWSYGRPLVKKLSGSSSSPSP